MNVEDKIFLFKVIILVMVLVFAIVETIKNGGSIREFFLELIPKKEVSHTSNQNISGSNNSVQRIIDGFQLLLEKCVNAENKLLFENCLNELVKEKNNDRYSVLNKVVEFQYERGLNFILAFDWKQDIKDLNCMIDKALLQNYNETVPLPSPLNFKGKPISSVFPIYDNEIKERGFMMSFLDTEADEFIAVLHRISDRDIIKKGCSMIGFKYISTEHPFYFS
ncbi:DUF6630 family protein [Jiulongibacter sp. NS-SX5]|uniref:DUF6630 family protein n=1 Tax=Jiulongibacter sp. NS-SX5 TaxID=3463854 RepID=UPI0040592709